MSPFSEMWPEGQRFIGGEALERGRARCAPGFEAMCRELRIEADLSPYLTELYLPLAAWLDRRWRDAGQTLVAGLCGGQGSGKSTVTALLGHVLEAGFGRRVVGFSIDDLYHPRSERQRLARTVHPLFATRGVPGTHEVELGTETIARLQAQADGASTPIPSFDKATDTRRPEAEWPVWQGPADIVIFEGWCVGARPQAETALEVPVNPLEAREDPDGRWRTHSNRALAGEYQTLFGCIDVLMLLQVDGMERVFEWRRLQERKLAESAAASGADPSTLAIMSEAEVDRFVMHYERLTRHILAEMPARADIVLELDRSHNPGRVRINRPI